MKNQNVNTVEKMTDRQKVEAWLTHIGEHDTACRAEVIQHCKDDIDARRYYVGRYESDCTALTEVMGKRMLDK